MSPANCILFSLSLTATPTEVDEVVQAIYDFYQIERASGSAVDPATLVAATTQQDSANASVEVDSTGLPWDERIHASTKGKNNDGSWKKRRGVDEKTVKKIEGQLRATMAASAPAGTPPSAPAAASLPPPPSSSLPPPPTPKSTTFTEIVNFITSKHADNGGPISDDWLAQVLGYYGVADSNLQNAAHLPEAKQVEMLAWLRENVK